jgi:hypothetical protein
MLIGLCPIVVATPTQRIRNTLNFDVPEQLTLS